MQCTLRRATTKRVRNALRPVTAPTVCCASHRYHSLTLISTLEALRPSVPWPTTPRCMRVLVLAQEGDVLAYPLDPQALFGEATRDVGGWAAPARVQEQRPLVMVQ